MNNRYREEEKEEMKKTSNESDESIEETISLDDSNAVDLEKQELIEELKTYKDKYLRVHAEFENFKKRTNEERIRERKYFNQRLIEKLVDTLDIFDKTINMKTDDETLKNFLIGFKMINDNFKQILADEGVKLIESKGEKFNPAVHDAIETDYDGNQEEGIILEEIQRGYMFKDRVLRPALVKVNKNKEENNNG